MLVLNYVYNLFMNKTATKGYKMEKELTLEELMQECESLPSHLIDFVKTQIILERAQVGLSVSEMLKEIDNNKN